MARWVDCGPLLGYVLDTAGDPRRLPLDPYKRGNTMQLDPRHAAVCIWQDNPGSCTCGMGASRTRPGWWASRNEQAEMSGEHAVYHCTKCWKVVVCSRVPYRLRGAREEVLAGRCFSCQFWWEVAEAQRAGGKLLTCVVNGTAYQFDRTHPFIQGGHSGSMGFAGAVFDIEVGGRIWRTNNLWCRGDVPPIWRGDLPDNATFVNRRHALVPANFYRIIDPEVF